jgi:transcriptional regulator with XRE-family HTH domain
MSIQTNMDIVPEWSLGDRLRKARTMTGMTVAEFAAAIGVSDKTVNNAEGDKRGVRPITLNAWAMATGVSREWLETGVPSGRPTPPGGGGRPTSKLDRLTQQKLQRVRKGDTETTCHYFTPAASAA